MKIYLNLNKSMYYLKNYWVIVTISHKTENSPNFNFKYLNENHYKYVLLLNNQIKYKLFGFKKYYSTLCYQ